MRGENNDEFLCRVIDEQGRLLCLAGLPDSVEIFPILSQRFGAFLRKLVAGIPDFAFDGPFDF